MSKSIVIENTSDANLSQSINTSRPWGRAMQWLLILGPFFFLSYGFSNWLAAHNPDVGHMVFDWEQHIPFIPWTIIPYWSIDLLYVLSFFICTQRNELDNHARRLLTAQVIAVTCFILFPLEFSFTRPETTGLNGWLFSALSQFDQPYNQAPSLHITLLVILWVLYARHLPRKIVGFFHLWCLLIAISVLTTYQHHFFDIPTGILLGWLSIWLWPFDKPSPLKSLTFFKQPKRWKIAGLYLIASISFFASAWYLSFNLSSFNALSLILFWPAISLLLVSLNYLFFDTEGFQKNSTGEMSLATKWLFFPYTVGAYINSRLWTRNSSQAVHIEDGIYLGRFPSAKDLDTQSFDVVIDLTAELPRPEGNVIWHCIPNLDLLTPDEDKLKKAQALITHYEGKGKVLVCCALGYSRSALAIQSWLLATKRVKSVEQAIQTVRVCRPGIVINQEGKQALQSIQQQGSV